MAHKTDTRRGPPGVTIVGAMQEFHDSSFRVPKMDCPAEERLIRLALGAKPGVKHLDFALADRRLTVTHQGEADEILALLTPLRLGAELTGSGPALGGEPAPSDLAGEARVLRQVLAINGTMFVVEFILGLLAQSTGLLADSFDMLADAMVYGLSLAAVGGALSAQRRAARVSGVVQVVLALAVMSEVVRRVYAGSEPTEVLMIGVGLAALVANLASVVLLAGHRKGGIHLRASWIFTTTDALANIGVILAGVLVGVTGSALPDLVIGSLIALLVLSGAVRILRLPN